MKRPSRQLLGYLAIVLFGIGPILLAIVGGSIGTALGCRVDEGSAHPCVILGFDFGKALYSLGVLGWFSLATLPLAFLLAIGYTILLAVRGRRKAGPGPGQPPSRGQT